MPRNKLAMIAALVAIVAGLAVVFDII